MFKNLCSITLWSGAILLALPCRAATAPKAPDLTTQLVAMDKAAAASLDSWIYTVDGLDVTAWLEGAPVIIKVPILN